MARLLSAFRAAWRAFRATWREHASHGRFRVILNGRVALMTDSGAAARREMDRLRASENHVEVWDGADLRGVWHGRRV